MRPDTSQAEFAQDSARCEYEAASSTANYGSSMAAPYSLGAAIGQGIGLGIGKGMEQAKLIGLCLRARGYVAVPLNAQMEQAPVVWPLRPPPAPTEYSAPAAPATFAPAPPPRGLPGESRYLIAAESRAKAYGCSPPSATMTSKGFGVEAFVIGCPNGKTLDVTCDVAGCKIVR